MPPTDLPNTEPAAGATAPNAAPPRASILLVDDHAPNLVALSAILEPLGQELVTASSGEEALLKLLDYDFAVILMDVQMPQLDGIETVALIKQRKRSRDIPIIFLTALSRDAAHVFKGYEHGAVDYLLKPFEASILRSKVAVFVELYRQREQIRRQAELLREREREALERQNERRFRGLTDAMPLVVWAARPTGELYYVNEGWLTYSGFELSQSVGYGVLDAVHPEDREQAKGDWDKARAEREGFEAELRLKRRDGAWRWHLGRVVPERDERGAIVGWIATATDIDDRKRAEEARAQLLQREQRARAEAEAAREMAESASRTKDEFLATVSHELRTPLNAILGWTRILQSNALDPTRLGRALSTIERNARAQTQLIEDLLDVSRIISGKLRLEVIPVDLPAIASAAVDAVRPAAEAKQIALDFVTEPLVTGVVGDPDRLQQVVWNLLSNAIKFTSRGGKVSLRLARVDSQVEVEVRDNGQGISAEFLPYVFDRFRQADGATTRAHGGLGLGLAIVRHLVELHGGSVSVESEGLGAGARFAVNLPLRAVKIAPEELDALRPQRASDAPSMSDLPSLQGLRVLVVDDEPDARDLVATVLEHYKADVRAVGSVADALEAVKSFGPDVLVSDIGMPGEDGYSLIRKLRALPPEERGRIPAAALTAYARSEDSRKAITAGFQVHMAKPVEPAELVSTVARLAGREVRVAV